MQLVSAAKKDLKKAEKLIELAKHRQDAIEAIAMVLTAQVQLKSVAILGIERGEVMDSTLDSRYADAEQIAVEYGIIFADYLYQNAQQLYRKYRLGVQKAMQKTY